MPTNKMVIRVNGGVIRSEGIGMLLLLNLRVMIIKNCDNIEHNRGAVARGIV